MITETKIKSVEAGLIEDGFIIEKDDLMIEVTKGNFSAFYILSTGKMNAPYITQTLHEYSYHGTKKYTYDYYNALCAIVSIQCDFENWELQNK